MSNPAERPSGSSPRPDAPAQVDPGLGVVERRVKTVAGAGAALAVVGLVVTLLVGSGEGGATSDTAAPAATSETSAPAAPASAEPSTTAAPQKQNLDELDPVGGTAYTGAISVNGTSYPHAIYQQFDGCNTEVSHTYELGDQWSRFTSTAGIADGANTGSVLQFEVVGDGKSLYSSGNVGIGDTPKVDVSVADIEKLTISFTFVDGSMASCSQAGNGVWGDPALTK